MCMSSWLQKKKSVLSTGHFGSLISSLLCLEAPNSVCKLHRYKLSIRVGYLEEGEKKVD